MNRKWFARTFVALLAVNAIIPAPVWAGENEMMDALIHKLVEKKVLTSEEAWEIKKEVAEESIRMAKVRAEEVKDTAKKMKGGAWLDKVKWGGDLRVRHETQRRNPAVDRNRERFRLRFGFKANPIDPLEVGVRLATGASGDPTSTNQSFTATFDKKAIFVDQAYGKYTPWKGGSGPLAGLSLTGGKMENPFVTLPEGIVWDGDVTPEGVALQWKNPDPLPVLDKLLPVTPFINAGGFAITELSGDHGDPGLFGGQIGADIKLPWDFKFQPSAAYYNFTGVKGINVANVTNSPAGNTTVTKGAARYLASDYNLVAVTGKLDLPKILGQPVSLLADYTHNEDNKSLSGTDDPNVDDDGAYAAGIQVGKVTEKFGSWQAFAFKKRVEADSTFGAIADSDFGGGGTNHKGYIFGAQMGLNKYASVGLKYFRTDEIEGTQNRFDTFQADLQLKY
ncbi:MAG: putative porin [Candidatus Omnitrophica bacterium]|nr:putative porin [Candidatus Omnitrophota bacterium]